MCIEFYGTLFHADPLVYECYDNIPFKNITAMEIWENDKERIELINEKYPILIIWEREFLNNPEDTIDKCLKFLKK